MTLPQLPPEVLRRIIRLTVTNTGYLKRYAQLQLYCRVSKSWAALARAELFRHVKFTTRFKTVQFLKATKDGRGRMLARSTISLHLDDGLASAAGAFGSTDSRIMVLHLLRACVNLRHLSIEGIDVEPSTLSIAAGLETLALLNTHLKLYDHEGSSEKAHELQRLPFAWHLPNLRQLKLCYVTGHLDMAYTTNMPLFSEASFPRLSSLQVEYLLENDEEAFNCELWHLPPSLTAFDLQRSSSDWARAHGKPSTMLALNLSQNANLTELSISLSSFANLDEINPLPSSLQVLRVEDTPEVFYIDELEPRLLAMLQRHPLPPPSLSLPHAYDEPDSQEQRKRTSKVCERMGIELFEEDQATFRARSSSFKSWQRMLRED